MRCLTMENWVIKKVIKKALNENSHRFLTLAHGNTTARHSFELPKEKLSMTTGNVY